MLGDENFVLIFNFASAYGSSFDEDKKINLKTFQGHAHR